jgi:hypothetical protein
MGGDFILMKRQYEFFESYSNFDGVFRVDLGDVG